MHLTTKRQKYTQKVFLCEEAYFKIANTAHFLKKDPKWISYSGKRRRPKIRLIQILSKKYFKIFCWLIFYILFLLKIAAAGKSLNYCSVVTYDFRVRQKNAILKVREDHCDFSTNPNCDLWSLSKSKATDGGALKSPPWSCPFSENIIKLWVVRAVVVAQLLQRSLPTLEIRTLNPAIGKNIERLLSTE